MSAAIDYANMAVVLGPTQFSMLELAARQWLAKEDFDRTYHYACRMLENLPIPTPDIPKWTVKILILLSLVPKFKRIDKTALESFSKFEKSVSENFK